MVIGASCFFYFAINAMTLVRLSTRIETVHVIIGVVGILVLMELCRRCVGLPILCVAGALIVYAFINQLSYAGAVNGATLYDALKTIIYKLFYTTSGVIGTPVNVAKGQTESATGSIAVPAKKYIDLKKISDSIWIFSGTYASHMRYDGTTEPSADLGVDGDEYLMYS